MVFNFKESNAIMISSSKSNQNFEISYGLIITLPEDIKIAIFGSN